MNEPKVLDLLKRAFQELERLNSEISKMGLALEDADIPVPYESAPYRTSLRSSIGQIDALIMETNRVLKLFETEDYVNMNVQEDI